MCIRDRCSLMGMSRTSFYNKLRALTDQAPGDYIRLIRLKRAVQLLKEDTPVSYTHLDVYKRQMWWFDRHEQVAYR